jgi:hypothetical protein
MKLSDRAKKILLTVDEYSEVDWSTGNITKFLAISSQPRRGFSVRFQKEFVYFYGGSDVAVLRSLVAKGLIDIWYVITELGRQEAERILELEYYDQYGKIDRR